MGHRFLLRKAYEEFKVGDFKSLAKKTCFYLRHKLLEETFSFEDEFEKWKKINDKLALCRIKMSASVKKGKIVFLVPGVAISGGIAIVLQHANRLLKKGLDIKILSLGITNDASWFPDQRVEILAYRETRKVLESGEIDVLIATGYSTAFSVALSQAKRKIYFVQSDESRFFPEDPALCEKIKETYQLPMEYITEALWIQKWLKAEYGQEAYYVPNGLDLEVFKKIEPRDPKNKKPRVLIEGAINVTYKGMIDAYNAVKDLDCELWIISSNGKPKPDWQYNKFFESVPFSEMNKMYSSCDIFLKMSRVEGFFGPPMEAMACGCAVVVGKVTGYDEYIVDNKNALVVEQGDIDGAKKAVQQLIDDRALRERLIQNGYQTAKEWTWEKSIDAMEKFLLGS